MLNYTWSFSLINRNNHDDTVTPFFSVTHHIDGIYWTDAVDKHVCVDHRRFDCKEAKENAF